MRIVAISIVGLLALTPCVGHGEVIVFSGGTLIDGSGNEPLAKSTVVIENERVVYAGSQVDAPVPEGSKTIDTSGKYLLPGFADMHNHLANGSFDLGRASSTWWGPLNASNNLRCLLARGVTTVFDPDIDVDTFVELKRLTRENPAEYPNFFGTGPSFTQVGGHGSREGNTRFEPESARARVRDLKAAGIDGIKLIYTDLTYVSKEPRPMLEREILIAVIDEAHRQGLKAYVHAPVLRFAKHALQAGADGLVHGIINEPIDEEFVTLMKRNNAVYMPTHSIFYAAADLRAWAIRLASFERSELIPSAMIQLGAQAETVTAWEQVWDNLAWLRRHLQVLRANTKAAIDAGIFVVAGSDTGNPGTGTFPGLTSHVELELLAEADIPSDQIVQMMSLKAARMIGREGDMGSLEAGKLADMVILNEDPLADIRNVRNIHTVVKSGHVYSVDEFSGCILEEASLDAVQRQEFRSNALDLTNRVEVSERITSNQPNSRSTEIHNE